MSANGKEPFSYEDLDDDGSVGIQAGSGTWVSQELIEAMQEGFVTAKQMFLLSITQNSNRYLERSNEWIATRLGITIPTTRKLLSQLTSERWLKRTTEDGKRVLAFSTTKLFKHVSKRDNKRVERGLFVPYIIIQQSLPGTHALLWAYIASFRFGGKKCYASNKRLALQIGSKRAETASDILSNLLSLGLVKRSKRHGRRYLTAVEPVLPKT